VNLLFAAAVEIEAFCDRQGWRFAIIGGLAVQRWGEPRQTRDVDVAILTGLGGEERYVDALLAAFRARLPEARQFALQHRVLLIETASGVPLDVSLAGLPFEGRVIDRASAFPIAAEAHITTCSAEDLVVLKAFADRVQDWLDIEGIIVRQAGSLDREQIMTELRPLLELKDDDATGHRLRALFEKHRG
jgi:hypothetical protein